MGRLSVTIPYFRQTASGCYWEPSRKIRGMGFAPEPLGKDLLAAQTRARKLNEQVEKALADGRPAAQPAHNTVSWWVAEYRKSKAWARLAPKTQRGYDQCLARVEKWAGSAPIESVSRKAVKVWQGKLEAKAPAYAAATLRVLRVVVHFAKDGGRKVADLSRLDLHTAGGNAEAWEDYEISAYCDEARRQGRQSMALALMLGVCLGQREGDVLRLARNQVKGDAIELAQSKTKRRIAVPILPELAAEIARTPKASPLFVVSEKSGKAYGEDNFRHVHREICRGAGIPDARKFMHLRHTAATRLGEAGCSDEQIRAVTGHKSREVVSRYVRPNSAMARGAHAKVIAYRKSTLTENG